MGKGGRIHFYTVTTSRYFDEGNGNWAFSEPGRQWRPRIGSSASPPTWPVLSPELRRVGRWAYKFGSGPTRRSLPLSPSARSRSTFSIAPATAAMALRHCAECMLSAEVLSPAGNGAGPLVSVLVSGGTAPRVCRCRADGVLPDPGLPPAWSPGVHPAGCAGSGGACRRARRSAVSASSARTCILEM